MLLQMCCFVHPKRSDIKLVPSLYLRFLLLSLFLRRFNLHNKRGRWFRYLSLAKSHLRGFPLKTQVGFVFCPSFGPINKKNEMSNKKARKLSETWVFWDINSFPVPKDCDARLVCSSIESALKKAGHCVDDLTITAIGNLNHTSQLYPDVLPAIFSTGVRLCHFPAVSGAFLVILFCSRRAIH
ncbi:unnamed protein product [Brassica oleracea]